MGNNIHKTVLITNNYVVCGWVLTNVFCSAAKHMKTCNLKHYLIYYSFLTGFGCTNNFKLVSSDNKLT